MATSRRQLPRSTQRGYVADDTKLRLLKEDLAEKQRMEARAIWEAEAAQRAEAAFKRRAAQRQMQERQTMHEELRQVRHLRLKALYEADMLQYEQELNDMGLTLASQDA